MSLSQDPVLSLLRTRFVSGFRDITGEPFAGLSGDHVPGQPAARTSNGAGPHNVQLFVLAPDGTVLHLLPGYWDPRDLALELGFALELFALHQDTTVGPEEKERRMHTLHLEHAASHPQALVERSVLTGFDAKRERKQGAASDFVIREDGPQPARLATGKRARVGLETTDQVLHERLAKLPYPTSYRALDLRSFTYGKRRYDKHGKDGG